MSDGESVKVAVRVRPFNQREIDRNAKVIIKMTGNQTVIINPENPSDQKKFAFDYSYWSHDQFSEAEDGILEPSSADSPYASQRIVFDNLGQGVLDNAFEGYNCSLFAYGQTGSGKSYSMVGYGPNRGIVPIICDELFKTMATNTDRNKRFEVTFSMLEIYNENVRDLLSKENLKGGLPVRQNPSLGFYVQGLKKVPVGSYKEIEARMEQGTNSRTVAATNMNATSSRAHTVVAIIFDQIIKDERGETKKSSVMNLVDLAGSERADSTGATGDRLKEGANINKSLSALGNVISALADLSMGKQKIVVPYRDSVLTKLLQNALGGNSKTIMIAALSPADINYDETLSTLRYADRAKKIKNRAIINENPMDKLVRELREENEKLRRALESGGSLSAVSEKDSLSTADIEQMRIQMEEEIRAQLKANMEALENNDASKWEQKLEAARAEEPMSGGSAGEADKRSKVPHLSNLNEDDMLSGVICHFFELDSVIIGRPDDSNPPNITLTGLSISKNHAVVTRKGLNFEIKPGIQGAKTKVNGVPLTGTLELVHNDRILFGSNHLYVFCNPLNTTCNPSLPKVIDYDFAQKELATAKGFQTGAASGLSKDQQIAQEQILEILPMVTEVNAISEELNKHRAFEVVLVSAAAQEGAYGNGSTNDGAIRVMVKMKNLLNENTWLWERGKFMNRRYLMQEMYQKYLEGDSTIMNIPHDEDPFWEPAEDVLIGTSNVFLQSLGYCLDFDDKLPITDYKGVDEGCIFVCITPCNQHGKPLDEDSFVDDPTELLKKPFHFKILIRRVEVNKSRFSKGIHVKYRVFKDEQYVETPVIQGTLEPEFKHTKIISFPEIRREHLDFFETGCVTFLVYGTQEDTMTDSKFKKMTTKELRDMERMSAPVQNRRQSVVGASGDYAGSGDVSRIKSELVTLQRKAERLESKEHRLQKLCDEWSQKVESERQFEPFFRAVAALAHSSGSKFKTNAEIIAKTSQSNQIVETSENQDDGDTAAEIDDMIAAQKSSNPSSPQPDDMQQPPVTIKLSNGSSTPPPKTSAVVAVSKGQGQAKAGSSTCTMM